MRLSWLSAGVLERARAELRREVSSWDDVFDGEFVRHGPPPDGFEAAAWPRLSSHVARIERVRETVARFGLDAARRRFGASRHAAERAALLEAGAPADLATVAGILEREIDEYLAYGELLSRLVELAASEAAGAVRAFEQFVTAAGAVTTGELAWPERVQAARDGLAGLYVRVGRIADAEALFTQRLAEESDATVAISAARAFLEVGETARAVTWLERGAARARAVGREELEKNLSAKAASLRARLN